jgi:hypothetical protein
MAGRIKYDLQTLVYAETGTFYFAATRPGALVGERFEIK